MRADPLDARSARSSVWADAGSERSGPAELLALRLLAIGVGLMGLAIALTVVVLTQRDGDRSLPAWFAVLASAAQALAILTGLAAPWLPARGIRIAAALAVGGYGAMLVSFPLAQASAALERIPWVLSASGAAVCAALLAGGHRAAWSVLLGSAAAVLACRALAGGLDLDGIVNDAQVWLSGAVVCVIFAHVISLSRDLDRTAVALTAATARAATERGRLAARTRAAAIVHDEVLATLNLAASALPLPGEMLGRQAAGAADMLERLDAEAPASVGGLVAALADVAARADAGFTVRGEVGHVDASAEEALVGAARQALDNSIRHAGADAHRWVEVRAQGGGVRVEVGDDGRGFVPGAVPAARLGIRSSIVGRLRDVAGGAAEVHSVPGEGTRVVLTWEPPALADIAAEGDVAALHRGLGLIAVVFVAGQALCALVAAVQSTRPWVPLAVLVALLVTAEVLRRAPEERPSTARTALFLALVVALVAVAVAGAPFTFGETWPVTAAAFLLVALVFRGRTVLAVLGLVSVMAVAVAAGGGAGADAVTIGSVTARPVALVLLTVLLVSAVDALTRRSRALHARVVAASERAAWDAAARAELGARAGRLRAEVVPLLRRIAAAGIPDADLRRACAAVEGELRDEVRAGVLAREPLTGAVRAARRRGVDVVLLDDRGGPLEDARADEVVEGAARLVAGARERVVVRLLPEGREEIATVAVDGRTTAFGG